MIWAHVNVIIKFEFAMSLHLGEKMENKLELKTVNKLCEYKFFIPSYQRGYRWTKQEVTDLLNDIDEFRPREIQDAEEKTWYCLQPIVVKKRPDGQYEVIDGQQRLTTIYLILHYLNQDYVEEKREKLFELDYETRSRTKEFLSKPNIQDDSNIDFYYISSAYHTIEKWFSLKGRDFDTNGFRSKFKFNTKIIWYEAVEDNSISIFTRLNIGKISLTNSELIKALFLNSSNYNKDSEKRIKLRQLEIANEWDNIEIDLQDDKLWYFICDTKITNNRIELIFNLIAGKIPLDDYSTFRFFGKRMKARTEAIIDENWQEIKTYYQRFKEWYKERDLYHKIGFILNAQIANLSELYDASTKMKKHEFRIHIDEIIENRFKKISLLDLQYDDKDVKPILLLYNILTMLQNNQDDSYFPFSTFKLGQWDVEHIASVKEAMPEKNRRDWLNDVKPYINTSDIGNGNDLLKEIEQIDENNEEKFKKLFEDIIAHFNYYMGQEEDVNGISNLALLDSATNRGYKNSVFPLKRKTIIDRDKSGIFIPICTKNVFLKYFSDYPPKISFWTEDDRKKYEEDLYRVLKKYIKEEQV